MNFWLKIREFGQKINFLFKNSKVLSKNYFLVNIREFGHKIIFWLKIREFGKNLIFG